MKKIYETKDKHEFKPLLVELEERPTSPLSRWLLWIVVAFMICMSLWLYFAKVDIVVSAQGKSMPTGEIKIVQPMETGVIKSILVEEGQEVKKGQTLMLLDPSLNKANLNAQSKNSSLLNLEIGRLNALINNSDFNVSSFSNINHEVLQTQVSLYTMTKEAHLKQQDIIKDQTSQIQNQIKGNQEDINRVRMLLKSAKKTKDELYKVLDIIAKKDYENASNQVIEYEEQIKIKSYEIKSLKSRLQELSNQLKVVKQEYKNKLLEELSQKRTKLVEINTIIKEIKFKSEKQFIKSPVDGYIGKLLVHTKGGVVTPAEKLLSIIPKDKPLVFKVQVLNQDIGFIEEDMDVSVKVDTYNFQKYGLIDAKVIHISDDAIEDEKKGLVYEVFIKPERYYLEYAGKKHRVNSGMSITAEVKIGKRRVINFFIYPLIRYLDEGMSVR